MVVQSNVSAVALNASCSGFDDDFVNKLSIQGSVSNNKQTPSDINTEVAFLWLRWDHLQVFLSFLHA